MFWGIILIGILLIGGIILYRRFFSSGKTNPKRIKQTAGKKLLTQSTTVTIDKFVEVEARVYDNESRTIYNSLIGADIVRQIRKEYGNLGRKWLRDGKWVYALNKLVNGSYRPVQVPLTLQDPPSELHRALQQHEIDIIFNVEESKGLLQKWGSIIFICGLALVAVFILIAQNIQG
jgi:hypothetical protein